MVLGNEGKDDVKALSEHELSPLLQHTRQAILQTFDSVHNKDTLDSYIENTTQRHDYRSKSFSRHDNFMSVSLTPYSPVV